MTADSADDLVKLGWSKGSPPLMVMMLVPRPASNSTRRRISATGTGSETLSYSLQ